MYAKGSTASAARVLSPEGDWHAPKLQSTGSVSRKMQEDTETLTKANGVTGSGLSADTHTFLIEYFDSSTSICGRESSRSPTRVWDWYVNDHLCCRDKKGLIWKYWRWVGTTAEAVWIAQVFRGWSCKECRGSRVTWPLTVAQLANTSQCWSCPLQRCCAQVQCLQPSL